MLYTLLNWVKTEIFICSFVATFYKLRLRTGLVCDVFRIFFGMLWCFHCTFSCRPLISSLASVGKIKHKPFIDRRIQDVYILFDIILKSNQQSAVNLLCSTSFCLKKCSYFRACKLATYADSCRFCPLKFEVMLF